MSPEHIGFHPRPCSRLYVSFGFTSLFPLSYLYFYIYVYLLSIYFQPYILYLIPFVYVFTHILSSSYTCCFYFSFVSAPVTTPSVLVARAIFFGGLHLLLPTPCHVSVSPSFLVTSLAFVVTVPFACSAPTFHPWRSASPLYLSSTPSRRACQPAASHFFPACVERSLFGSLPALY